MFNEPEKWEFEMAFQQQCSQPKKRQSQRLSRFVEPMFLVLIPR